MIDEIIWNCKVLIDMLVDLEKNVYFLLGTVFVLHLFVKHEVLKA
jgi:hypothetical protein